MTDTIRNKILEEKCNPEYIPDAHFVINLEKIINNKIDYLQAKKDVQSTSKDILNKKRLWHGKLNLKYAFSLVLLILLIITSGTGTYLITNHDKDKQRSIVNITPTPDQKLAAKAILAQVSQKFEERKKEIVSYKMISRQYYLGDTNPRPEETYCKYWIDYEKQMQRSDCGLEPSKELSMKQTIIKNQTLYELDYSKGKFIEQFSAKAPVILKDPEFTAEFYASLFKTDIFNNSSIIDEDQTSYTIQSVWNMDSLLNKEMFKIYAGDRHSYIYPDEQVLELKVDKEKKVITKATVSFMFKDGTKKALEIEISNIMNVDDNDDLFNEKTTKYSFSTSLNLDPITTKLDSKTGNFTITFNAKKETSYLLFRNGISEIIENGQSNIITGNQKDPNGIDLSENNRTQKVYKLEVYPFKKVNGAQIYGSGYEFYIFSQKIEKVPLDIPSLYTTIFEGRKNLLTVAASVTSKEIRIYEDKYMKLAVPEGWEVVDTDCNKDYANSCSFINIKKGNYLFKVKTDTLILNSLAHQTLCDAEITTSTIVTSVIRRQDDFADFNSTKPKSCGAVAKNLPGSIPHEKIFNKGQEGVAWIGSQYYSISILDLKFGGIKRSDISKTDSDDRSYFYSDIQVSFEYITKDGDNLRVLPAKDSPELQQMLKEADTIMNSFEFKK